MHVLVWKHDNREDIIWSMAFQLLPYSILLPPKNINQKSALTQKHIISYNVFKCFTAFASGCADGKTIPNRLKSIMYFSFCFRNRLKLIKVLTSHK